jgi:hypothetical protein
VDREEIADLVMRADTWDDCLKAEAALRDWLRKNPDDLAMWDIDEQLTLVKEAIQEERQSGPFAAGTAVGASAAAVAFGSKQTP